MSDERMLMLDAGTALYFAPNPDYDQGDGPNICAPCGGGQHDGCRDGAELGDNGVEMCDCTDGACGGGEWVEMGYTEPAGGVVTRQLGGPDLDARGHAAGLLTRMERHADNLDYVTLRHSGTGQPAA